jgi:hypothetical protein
MHWTIHSLGSQPGGRKGVRTSLNQRAHNAVDDLLVARQFEGELGKLRNYL